MSTLLVDAEALAVAGETLKGRTSNTPPRNCTGSIAKRDGGPVASGANEPPRRPARAGVVLLAKGIDTLWLGFRAVLAKAGDRTLWESLEGQKQLAQAGERPTRVFGGVEFEVQSHGGGSVYGYQLVNGDMTISVSRSASGETPSLMFRPACSFLWENGLEAVWRACADVARRVDVRGEEPKACLSRIDLATDWQGLPFERASFVSFVGRARTGSKHAIVPRPDDSKAAKGAKLARRRVVGKLEGDTESTGHLAGVKVSGFAFGVAPIRLRVYDKVREIKAGQNAKDFFFKGHGGSKPVWTGFDEKRPAWRVEIQLSREVLREIKVSSEKSGAKLDTDTVEGATAALGAWWRYVVGEAGGENGWLSWRVEGKDRTRSRWKVRAEWAEVQGVTWHETAKTTGVRKRERAAKAEQLEVMAAGCLTSIAALRDFDTLDAVMDAFRARIEGQLSPDMERPALPAGGRSAFKNAREQAEHDAASEVYERAVKAAFASLVRRKAVRLNSEHRLLKAPR